MDPDQAAGSTLFVVMTSQKHFNRRQHKAHVVVFGALWVNQNSIRVCKYLGAGPYLFDIGKILKRHAILTLCLLGIFVPFGIC